jgi:hypothetical protein
MLPDFKPLIFASERAIIGGQFSVCERRIRSRRTLTGMVFAFASDSNDSNFAARSSHEPFYVVWVACENRSVLPKGCRHDNGVNDVRGFGHT